MSTVDWRGGGRQRLVLVCRYQIAGLRGRVSCCGSGRRVGQPVKGGAASKRGRGRIGQRLHVRGVSGWCGIGVLSAVAGE